jgi:hypothetical protein
MAEPRPPGEVLIVGGGVAALETPMALRELAEARRYPLRRVVEDFDAGLGALTWR